MAFHRPVRYVMGATLILLVFLGFQILRNPDSIRMPHYSNGGKMDNMDRDPNHDSTHLFSGRADEKSREHHS